MDKIIKEINKLKDSESYKDILSKIEKYCTDEKNRIRAEKYEIKVCNALAKSKYINKEFKSMFKSIKVIENTYERADYHVWSTKNIQIGSISFSRTYQGDNEGVGNYCCSLSALDTEVMLCEEYDYDQLTKLSYSDEDYGDELLDLYQKLKFKTITQDMFLEYVSYIITTIMDL